MKGANFNELVRFRRLVVRTKAHIVKLLESYGKRAHGGDFLHRNEAVVSTIKDFRAKYSEFLMSGHLYRDDVVDLLDVSETLLDGLSYSGTIDGGIDDEWILDSISRFIYEIELEIYGRYGLEC